MTCPECRSDGAYQGLQAIECLNKACRFYSAAWERDQASPCAPIPIDDPDLVKPLPCSTCGSSSGMCFCLQTSGCGGTSSTSNAGPNIFTFTVGGKTVTCANGERVYRFKLHPAYWVVSDNHNGRYYSDGLAAYESPIPVEPDLIKDRYFERLA